MRLDDDGDLEFLVPLCDGERLSALELSQVGDDPAESELVWRAAIGEDAASRGRVPVDDDTVAELPADAELLVKAWTDRGHLVSSFALAELPADGSVLKKGGSRDSVMSIAEFDAAVLDDCTPSPWGDAALLGARLAVLVALVAAVAWYVVHRRRHRQALDVER